MDEIVIYPSRWKIIFILFGCIGFVLLSCFLLAKPSNRFPHLVVICIAWSGILFFGIIAIYASYRLIHHLPAVVINQEGIFDNASASGVGLIKWEEIQEIFLDQLMGNKMLGIIPRDFEAVIARQPNHRKYLMRLNSGFVKAPINIPQASLPISVEELHSQILDFHAALSTRTESF